MRVYFRVFYVELYLFGTSERIDWRLPTMHLLLFLYAALLNHSLIKYLCSVLFIVLLETFYFMRYCP